MTHIRVTTTGQAMGKSAARLAELGHKDAEITALYLNDRGLTAAEWKQVSANDQQPEAA